MASILSPNFARSVQSSSQENSSSRKRVVGKIRRMAEPANATGSLSFGMKSVLETIDNFLENNDGNHIVQLLTHIETRTNVSKKALARALLVIIVCYFLFSIQIFDIAANILLYFLPSYTTYVLLKKDHAEIDKNDLIHVCR